MKNSLEWSLNSILAPFVVTVFGGLLVWDLTRPGGFVPTWWDRAYVVWKVWREIFFQNASKTEPITYPLAVNLIKLSGDFQVVNQHHQVPEPIKVKVCDAQGGGIHGVPVNFYAAPGGFPLRGLTNVETDQDGSASWFGYLHSDGSQIICAAIHGHPPVEFRATVLQGGNPLDGMHEFKLSAADVTSDTAGLRIPVQNGVFQLDNHSIHSGSISFPEHQISFVVRQGLDNRTVFSGVLKLGADGSVRGEGTAVAQTGGARPATGVPKIWISERL
jgi:hypothetical protein